jgi:hypothetical protein
MCVCVCVCVVQGAQLELSDCKEAPAPEGVWRSATTMSGAQCVMTSGVLLMLKWPADSLDYPLQVRIRLHILYACLIVTLSFIQVLLLCSRASPMVLVRSGWTMSSVLELRPDSLTVLVVHWEPMTVIILKMLESIARVKMILWQQPIVNNRYCCACLNNRYYLHSRRYQTARRHYHPRTCGDLQQQYLGHSV